MSKIIGYKYAKSLELIHSINDKLKAEGYTVIENKIATRILVSALGINYDDVIKCLNED